MCKSNWLGAAFKSHRTYLISCLGILTLLFLAGCSSTPEEEEDETARWSAAELYKSAKNEQKNGNHDLAIQHFESLESRFPFSKYTPQAQLETAYSYYKYEEYDMAISSADRFIKLQPRHPHVDYAYYIRGIASFHKKDSPIDFLDDADPSQKDPASARESFNYFADLVKRYPKSKYAADAIKRMRFQRNTLAQHELNVANYYVKRGAYVAAVNRAKYVVENYPRTPAIPNALVLLASAYKSLDMQDLAHDTNQVLDLNFPNYVANKQRAAILAQQPKDLPVFDDDDDDGDE